MLGRSTAVRTTWRRAAATQARASSGAAGKKTFAFELAALYNREAVDSLAQNEIYGGSVSAASVGGAGHVPDHLAKYTDNPIRDKYMGKLAGKLAAGSANAQLKKSGRALRDGAPELLEALHAVGHHTVVVCPHDGFFKLPDGVVKERKLLRKGQVPTAAALRRMLPGCGAGGSTTLCGYSRPFLEAAAATGAPAVALVPEAMAASELPAGWEGTIPSVAAPRAKRAPPAASPAARKPSSFFGSLFGGGGSAEGVDEAEGGEATDGAPTAGKGAARGNLRAVRSLAEMKEALVGPEGGVPSS